MAAPAHRSALPEGFRLHNYVVDSVLGSGGFGITYRAHEEVTERAVAVKEYLPAALAVRERDGYTVQPVSDGSADDYKWGLDRFRQEARLLIGLKHPNIVPVLNYFEANGTAYLVMEYQDGETLAQRLSGARVMPEHELRAIMLPLMDGVEAVHRAGLLHRDIKPDNVFLRRDGTPVLIDFGSARQALGHHSLSLTAVVTDGYAPFEQYERDGKQGPWTDIYALGAVMFRCLVGTRPPTATTRLSASYRQANDPAQEGLSRLRDRCSKSMARAIEAALEVAAEHRPQSVADFRALIAGTGSQATVERPVTQLATLMAGSVAPANVTAETASTLPAAPARRRSRLPLFAGLAALLVAGSAGAFFAAGGPALFASGPTAAEIAEKKRLADETARRAAEEAERQRREEARRKAEEERERAEAARRAEDEARRRDEEKRREDEARKKAEDDRKKAEADAKKKAEDEKRKAEDEKRREEAEREKIGAYYFNAGRRQGMVFFAHAASQLEAGGRAALDQLAAAFARQNARVALIANTERDEISAAERARLKDARLAAIRNYLVGKGIAADRIRTAHGVSTGNGPNARYVSLAVAIEAEAKDPKTEDKKTPDAEKRYTREQLRGIMFRLIKGASQSINLGSGTERLNMSGGTVDILAACVDWSQSTPERAVVKAGYVFTASTAGATARAQAGCQSQGGANCTCHVIDAGGANMLQLPEAWAGKYAR